MNNAIEESNQALLLSTAKVIARNLKLRSEGTDLHIRLSGKSSPMNTDGWRVVIGKMGESQIRLEIWLDRFAGYKERKFYAGFRSKTPKPITDMTKQISKKWWPVRKIFPDEIMWNEDTIESYVFLEIPIKSNEFNAPIVEEHEGGQAFFGIYDPAIETYEKVNLQFCERAVAFFEDVARSISPTIGESDSPIYPQYENRKHVISHIQRERSRLLATDRKLIDNYTCQVCDMRFEDVYGKELGENYAEAHHIIPLSQLQGVVKTSIEDLRTVCANCHRMLHRMEGKREDIANLRKIVKRNRDS